jgi:hypothetical protein
MVGKSGGDIEAKYVYTWERGTAQQPWGAC